jgi:hypothetical protein
MEVMETYYLNEIYYGSRTLSTLDTTTVEADWLHEFLMDLPIVKKPLPTILMNYDN